MLYFLSQSNEVNTYRIGRIPFSEDLISGEDVQNNSTLANYKRHFIYPRINHCLYCKALMWKNEKLTNSKKNKLLFGSCCQQGKIHLPALNPIRFWPLRRRQLMLIKH